MLAAGDTFRAGAPINYKFGVTVGVEVIRQSEGS